MTGLDTDKVNEIIEHPEYFLVGTIGKTLAWSIYLPLRLVVKRADYINSLRIPSASDHKLSSVVSAVGTAAWVTTGLFTGISFGFEKGTSGYVTFRNCPLLRGQIADYSGYSIVAMAFPFNKNSVKGGIYANVKGLLWKNKILTGIELDLKNEEVKKSINDDKVLMHTIREFFETIIYWTGIKNVNRIRLEIKDINDKKYNIIAFTIIRPERKNIDLLIEHGKDLRRIPELIFDIAKGISEKITFASVPTRPLEEKEEDQNIDWL